VTEKEIEAERRKQEDVWREQWRKDRAAHQTPEGAAAQRRAADKDTAVGRDYAPARYSAKGRETIDRIRDRLGDQSFVAFCEGNGMKYEDRAGLKEGAAYEVDRDKARWYREMADHVTAALCEPPIPGHPDPRHNRPGFVPYTRCS